MSTVDEVCADESLITPALHQVEPVVPLEASMTVAISPPKHERLATLKPFGRKAQRRLCEKQEKVRISGLPFRRRPFELC